MIGPDNRGGIGLSRQIEGAMLVNSRWGQHGKGYLGHLSFDSSVRFRLEGGLDISCDVQKRQSANTPNAELTYAQPMHHMPSATHRYRSDPLVPALHEAAN